MNNNHVFQCGVLNQDKQNNQNIEVLTNWSLEEMKLVLNTRKNYINKLEIIDSLAVNPMIL